MSDIDLIVGVDVNESTEEIVKGLHSILNKIKSTEFKIKLTPDFEINDSNFKNVYKNLSNGMSAATKNAQKLSKGLKDANNQYGSLIRSANTYYGQSNNISGRTERYKKGNTTTDISRKLNEHGDLEVVSRRVTQKYQSESEQRQTEAKRSYNIGSKVSTIRSQLEKRKNDLKSIGLGRGNDYFDNVTGNKGKITRAYNKYQEDRTEANLNALDTVLSEAGAYLYESEDDVKNLIDTYKASAEKTQAKIDSDMEKAVNTLRSQANKRYAALEKAGLGKSEYADKLKSGISSIDKGFTQYTKDHNESVLNSALKNFEKYLTDSNENEKEFLKERKAIAGKKQTEKNSKTEVDVAKKVQSINSQLEKRQNDLKSVGLGQGDEYFNSSSTRKGNIKKAYEIYKNDPTEANLSALRTILNKTETYLVDSEDEVKKLINKRKTSSEEKQAKADSNMESAVKELRSQANRRLTALQKAGLGKSEYADELKAGISSIDKAHGQYKKDKNEETLNNALDIFRTYLNKSEKDENNSLETRKTLNEKNQAKKDSGVQANVSKKVRDISKRLEQRMSDLKSLGRGEGDEYFDNLSTKEKEFTNAQNEYQNDKTEANLKDLQTQLNEVDVLLTEHENEINRLLNERENKRKEEKTGKTNTKEYFNAKLRSTNTINSIRKRKQALKDEGLDKTQYYQELDKAENEITGALDSYQISGDKTTFNAEINRITASVNEFKNEEKEALNIHKEFKKSLRSDGERFQTDDVFLKKNKSFKNDFKTAKIHSTDFESGTKSGKDYINSVKNIKKPIDDYNKELKDTTTWGDRARNFQQSLLSLGINIDAREAVISSLRTMVQESIAVDTAMTELRKVTNETDSTYSTFLNNATTRSQELGATLSDIINSTADFARLGYDIFDASKLADAATVYKNVGDGIQSIEQSSQSIISTMQAFGYGADDAMSIVDKFNEIGNTEAISSGGIGDALLRSASAMKAANNTLDETVALAAGSNTIAQDPEKVGTALKTVSMRLRGARTEMEDAGEDTDGMATSVSKLRKELKSLTGVDIQLDNSTFKSTYQILEEISKVWHDLDDVTQANVLEKIAGKHQGNIISGLLDNFSVSERALETSKNAEGGALKENEKYLNSVQGRVDVFKATLQSLSQNFMNSDLLKFGINVGSTLLNIGNGIVNVTKAIGGLWTVIPVLSTILTITKVIPFFTKKGTDGKTGYQKSFLHGIVEGIKTFSNGVKDGVSGAVQTLKEGKNVFSSLKSGYEGFAGNFSSKLSVGIGAIGTAASVASAIIFGIIEHQKRLRDEAINRGNEAQEASETAREAYLKYEAAKKEGFSSQEESQQATNSYLEALDLEAGKIDALVGKYGSYSEAMRNAAKEKIKDSLPAMEEGYKGKLENAKDASGMSWAESMVLWDSRKYRDDNTLSTNSLRRLRDAGIINDDNEKLIISNTADSTPHFNWDEASNEQELIEKNKLLKESVRYLKESGELSPKDLEEDATYRIFNKAIQEEATAYDDLTSTISEINNNKAFLLLFDKMDSDVLPKNATEMKAWREELIKTATESGGFKGSVDDITSAIDTQIQTLPELKDAYEQYLDSQRKEEEQLKKIQDTISKEIERNNLESIGGKEHADEILFKKEINNLLKDGKKAAEDYANSLSDSLSGAKLTATDFTNSISEAYKILSSQQNGKSISIADFNSDSLKDYREALEYTNGTLQLNAEKVRELALAKAEEEKATIRETKATDVSKYKEQAEQIEKLKTAIKNGSLSRAEDIDNAYATIEALRKSNEAIANGCEQYNLYAAAIDEANGAYQRWLDAQSGSDYGDMADDAASAAKKITDTFDSENEIYGNFGSKKYKAAVEFIIPDSINPEDTDAINNYMNSISDYFARDENGAIEGLNLQTFLDNAVKNGLMTATTQEDGKIKYDIVPNISTEDFAEQLNLSKEMVQAFFDESQLKGFKFDFSGEAVQDIDDLAIRAYAARDALTSLENYKDLQINLDVDSLNTTDEKIKSLDDTIRQVSDIRGTVSIDSAEANEAATIISYCVAQKQQLTAPDILRVDTSKLSDDIGLAISLLQEFQNSQYDLELRQTLNLDTTEAQEKVDSIFSKLQNNSTVAYLGVDTSSVENALNSIKSLTSDTLVTRYGVDASAIQGYKADDTKANVLYEPDTSNLPKEIHTPGVVHYTADTFGLPTTLPPIYQNIVRTISETTTNAQKIGMGFFGGIAHAGGYLGTDKTETALTGELGRELVVNPDSGRWYTVGDNGAEFTKIPKGSIVFNHLQTEQLLKNGHINSRGNTNTSGTALASGKQPFGVLGTVVNMAFKTVNSVLASIKKNNGVPQVSGSGTIGGSSNSAKNNSTKSSTSNRSSGGGSNYSRSSGSSRSSNNSSSSGNSKEDSKQKIDWIEIAIDRIERAIDKFSTIASSAFRKLGERLSANNSQISELNKEISIQQRASDRYLQQANSVGLSGDIAEKVKNGTIDINEYDSDTGKKIEEYQKWYEKSLDSTKNVLELGEKVASAYKDKFEAISKDFENQLSLLEHLSNTYNSGISDIEERGYLATTKYYEALREVERQNIDVRKRELNDLTNSMTEALNSGRIAEYSEQWYDFQKEINSVKESIQESETSVIKFGNSIREVKWDHFDYLQKQIGYITEEANFLIDLMEKNNKLFEDNGQLNNLGMATMGLHGQNYNVYMAQADKYAEEIKQINKELAEDPYNTKLLDRREELLKTQRESILNAEEEKAAIVSLVKEGIEKELDSLKKLIDKYNESMDKAKDLYDYNKNVKEQAKEIATYQKQLNAYANDTSEETKAIVQKIQISLTEAQEQLQETEYEHYISEQKKLLDELYTEYETLLNERLDNVDALVSDMLDTVNANSATINDTLINQAEKVGYVITENEKQIWSNEGSATAIITKYGESFVNKLTTVNEVLSKIAYKVGAMTKESDAKANNTVKNTTTTTPKNNAINNNKNNNSNNNNNKNNKFSEDVKRGVAAAIWIYGSRSGWGENPERRRKLTEKFGSANATAIQSYINSNTDKLYDWWVSNGRRNLSQYYYNAYKNGGLADYTGVAWIDGTPSNPEMVLNAKDTSNFIALKDAMKNISTKSAISDIFKNNENAMNILSQLSKVSNPNLSAAQNNIGDITYQINIPIENVQDYNDFMNQLKKDDKFEKMIQSMTIDRLVGKSNIAKNKFKW